MSASYHIENNEIIISIPGEFDMHMTLTEENLEVADQIIAVANYPKKTMKERLEDLKMFILLVLGGKKLVETIELRKKGDRLVEELENMFEPIENKKPSVRQIIPEKKRLN